MAHGAARSWLDLAPVEDLEAQAAPNGLRLEQVLCGTSPVVIIGGQGDAILAELERHLAALEVITRRDLAPRLVECIDQLLLVEVAHQVE